MGFLSCRISVGRSFSRFLSARGLRTNSLMQAYLVSS